MIKINLLILIIVLFQYSLAYSKSYRTIVFLGDSLTEGYGVSKERGYVSLIEKKLKKEGQLDLKIINGSVSGSTSASAPSRLKWFLKAKPQIIVLALGANDGLRGVKIESIFNNLSKTIKQAQKNKIKILLLGLRMPPNYGVKYTNEFKNIYSRLKKKHKIKYFVPYLLEGVAGEPKLNQPDGIHPNESGHKKLMNNIYPTLRRML